MNKLLLALTVTMVTISCKKNEVSNSSSSITVIRDITDPATIEPIANPILALYDFKDNKNQSASFRFVTISDKRLNPVTEFQVDNVATTDKQNDQHDPQLRDKLIMSFYQSVRSALSDSNENSKHHLDRTECFRTISGELKLLSQSDATSKYLIIFSDIAENSSLLNCYSKKGQSLLERNRQTVINRFNKAGLLPPKLNGINVFFVYRPKSRAEDQRFYLIESVYKTLLESRGAKVLVQAQCNSYDV